MRGKVNGIDNGVIWRRWLSVWSWPGQFVNKNPQSFKPLLLICCFFCTTGLAPADFESKGVVRTVEIPKVVKRALLVGVNVYKDSSLPALRGSINDIRAMQRLLEVKFGHAHESIEVLVDSSATRHAIFASLDRLIGEANVDDIVYIHFSGYGSFIPTSPGIDAVKETILPYDARTDNIPDIEVSELRARIAKFKTRSVVLVLDASAWSMGGRGAKVLTRAVDPDDRAGLYKLNAPNLPAGMPSLVITAGHARQPAIEAPIDGKYHGVMSYALFRALSSSQRHATVKDLVGGLEQEMRRVHMQLGLTFIPAPQIEIAGEDESLFAMSSHHPATVDKDPRLVWASVKTISSDLVLLERAYSIGAVPGSVWTIYPPGDTAFLPGYAVSSTLVEELSGEDAIARVINGPVPPPGSRAVMTNPPMVNIVPIRVLVQGEEGKQLRDALANYFENVKFVTEADFARFVIEKRGKSIRLYAADGFMVIGMFQLDTIAKVARDISTLVTQSTNAVGLLALDNPSSQLKVDARAANATSNFQILLRPSEKLNPNRQGQSTNLRVKLYQLSNKDRFERVSYESLRNNNHMNFRDDILWNEELSLKPEDYTVPVSVDLHQRTKYIAVVAFFRDQQSENWRKVIPITSPDTRAIEVRLADHSIGEVIADQDKRKVTLNTAPVRVHILRPGEPRTSENSLQLQIKVNCDCYVTLLNVDSTGKVGLLFPTPEDDGNRGFYPEGLVPRDTPILIPDSLQEINKAHFHLDYSDPPGIDTIRVFATNDRSLAIMLREETQTSPSKAILQRQPLERQDRIKMTTLSAGQAPFLDLRARMAEKGVIRRNPNEPILDNDKPIGTRSDWAAASVTVLVEP